MTRMAYNSRRGRVRKTLKDYMIPVAWILIILLVIISVFSWGGNGDTWSTETSIQSWTDLINVTLDDATTEAYIIWEKEEKTLISWSSKLLPTQRLIVKEWTVSLESGDFWTFKLNKMWELSLDDKGLIKLISSDLWLRADKSLNIETIYLKAKISPWTVISINQNEALSTIYVISWTAEVSNLAWKKTLLWNLQKLTISRQDASNKDIDLSITKDNIDEFFKNSEWYVKNNWDSFLNTTSTTSSWSTWIISETNTSDLLELDDLRDEAVVSSSKLSISWKYSNDFVSSIILGDQKAKLDTENKTFSFGTIVLDKKVNDLVFKLFDTDENLIWKVPYTIYYNWVISSDAEVKTSTDSSSSAFEVKNFQVDWSKFIFTAPWTSPYTTTESLVTIRWQVPSWMVSKVTVNWFQLWSFNWTTWRYHADSSNDNLKDWTNVYEVKYYGEWWKLIYTNSFVIIKKPKLIESPSDDDSSTATWEIVG